MADMVWMSKSMVQWGWSIFSVLEVRFYQFARARPGSPSTRVAKVLSYSSLLFTDCLCTYSSITRLGDSMTKSITYFRLTYISLMIVLKRIKP